MFINRPRLLTDESVGSYLWRLSQANGYETPFIILKEFKIKRHEVETNFFPEEVCTFLVDKTEISADAFSRGSFNLITKDFTKLQEKFFLTKYWTKYCPECLKEEPHHQLLWSINIVSNCSRHGSLLLEKCPHCQKRLNIPSLLKDQCKSCHLPLSHAPKIEIKNEFTLKTQREIINKIKGENTSGFLADQSIKKCIELLLRSMYMVHSLKSFTSERTIHSHFVSRSRSSTNEQILDALSNIFFMYQDFPMNLHLVFDRFFTQPYETRKYRWREFSKLFSSHEFSHIKKAYEIYDNRKIRNRMVPLNFKAFHPEKTNLLTSTFLNKNEFRASLNISRTKMDQLFKNKLLETDTVKIGQEKYCYRITKDQLSEFQFIKKQENDFITRKEAAEFLGISTEVILKLIQAGLLQPQHKTGNKNTYLVRSELISLLKKCKVIGNLPDQVIALRDLLPKGYSISFLLLSMKTGAIKGVTNRRNFKISDIFFYKHEIDNLTMKRNEEKHNVRGYTFTEAACILGISERTLHKYIEHHVIIPKTKPRSNSFIFDKHDLLLFQKTFITVPKAVQKYGISASKLRNFIYKGQLKDYLAGVNKTLLLKSAELEKLLNSINK
ncbi:TniQ family protein [Bacillus sp. EB01]|uniref:TniQ family protein n=1 Tax=Bacillus sp. EB01 TaxID=1347086 RepID=UPI0005C5F22A|nr:TniQ family protein [Bacillus sp. EB01]